MGMLVDGKWQTDDVRYTDTSGRFVRRETTFRHWITADGRSGFPAEAGRYHLYVSLACPWAHRTLIMRALKGLEDAISLSVVDYHLGPDGWHFSDRPGAVPDTVLGTRFLREVYLKADPAYTGRVSVPVLWDTNQATIVNNESREILRMLDTEFDAVAKNPERFLPAGRKAEVDAMIDANYTSINNGVYRTGFARTQAAYDEAVKEVFTGLNRCEALLERQRYLCGERITEADWCLFTTLVRFDAVYVTHFKCNLRRIVDYSNLWNYLKDLYQVPGVAETVNFEHIKGHYFGSHLFLNPTGIVPIGPRLDLGEPHDRAKRSYRG
jgi:glutathionyl-hydroquinone reductase